MNRELIVINRMYKQLSEFDVSTKLRIVKFVSDQVQSDILKPLAANVPCEPTTIPTTNHVI